MAEGDGASVLWQGPKLSNHNDTYVAGGTTMAQSDGSLITIPVTRQLAS
jgi:hypothetical protein